MVRTVTRPSARQVAAPVQFSSFPQLLKRVQKQTDTRLKRLLREREKEAARLSRTDIAPMVSALRSLIERGGKRLRPALAYLGALCVSPEVDEDLVLEVGVTLELLQAYFLVHDDWMDQDELRRGGPTVHVLLTQEFESPHLGASSAILAGDYALGIALAQFAQLPLRPARLAPCLARFSDMQIAAIYGQQLDIVARTENPELTYELKTASYTVQGPLLLGAELMGAKPALLETLEKFSLPAGIAFQLRDDLIGVYGAPEHTGKPHGSDLLAGKNTPLVQYAFSHGSPEQIEAIQKVFGKKKASASALKRALSALDNSGARAHIEARIDTLCKQAEEALTHRSLQASGKKLLGEALTALCHRTY